MDVGRRESYLNDGRSAQRRSIGERHCGGVWLAPSGLDVVLPLRDIGGRLLIEGELSELNLTSSAVGLDDTLSLQLGSRSGQVQSGVNLTAYPFLSLRFVHSQFQNTEPSRHVGRTRAVDVEGKTMTSAKSIQLSLDIGGNANRVKSRPVEIATAGPCGRIDTGRVSIHANQTERVEVLWMSQLRLDEGASSQLSLRTIER